MGGLLQKYPKLLLFMFFFLFGVSLVLLDARDSNEILPTIFDYNQERERLTNIIEKEGAAEMYEHFKDAYQSFDPDEVHKLAHWVGAELYQKEGVAGLALCDNSYNWGCYHGFFGEAFSYEGISLVEKAEAACQNDKLNSMRFGGCIHGLGHGILVQEGYEYEDLLDALEDCDTLNPDARSICRNGVFMEYNKKTMHGLESKSWEVRPLNPENPKEPCDNLPSLYTYDCYYELPAWWEHVFDRDYNEMGEICSGLEGRNKEACFRGVGRLLPVAFNYNQEQSAEVCSKMPGEGERFCIWDVVEVMLLMKKILELSVEPLSLCGSLSSSYIEECISRGERYMCDVLSECKVD